MAVASLTMNFCLGRCDKLINVDGTLIMWQESWTVLHSLPKIFQVKITKLETFIYVNIK